MTGRVDERLAKVLEAERPPERQVGDARRDGQHFVMIEKDPFEVRLLELVIVLGWVEEMKARVAAAR